MFLHESYGKLSPKTKYCNGWGKPHEIDLVFYCLDHS